MSRPVALLAIPMVMACGGSPAHRMNKGEPPQLDVETPWTDPEADYPTARATIKPKSEPPRSIAITNATILTAAGERYDKGTIVSKDGKIAYVGDGETQIPDGARVIDAGGRYVTPGIIDTHTHIGVYPVPHVASHSDGNEMTAPVTAQVRAEYGYWPQDPAITRAIAGGVTSALALPGSANLIGGRGFTVLMRPGRSIDDVRFPGAPQTIKMACGENPKRVYGAKGGPQTRMGEYAAFRTAFQQAAEYRAKKTAYRRNREQWFTKKKRAAELNAELAKKGDKKRIKAEPAPEPPPEDAKLATLAGVLDGDILVQIHCYKGSEIREMVAIANEFGFEIRSFHHALEAYKVRDLLVENGIAISTWADWWGFKMEAFDGIPQNAALFAESGGRAVIHSDSSVGIQRLNQEAAKAMYSGREAGIEISEDQALRWVTANPAWVLGIDDVTGTLAAGKRADVVLWNASPFSVYARPDVVMSGGEVRAAAADVIAIEGATVHTAPGTVLEDATVVIRDGTIAAVGAGVAVPKDATRIDGKGKIVTAGFVEPHTTLGLVEVGAVSSTVEGRFGGGNGDDTVHAAYRVTDGYNPASVSIPIARTGGITSAVSVPLGGRVAGTSAWLSLADAVDIDDVTVKTSAAMHTVLGERSLGTAKGSRGLAVENLRELLDDAAQYRKNKRSYERNQTRKYAAGRLDLEALVPVLAGRVPLVVSADRASDILAAVKLGKELKLRVVIAGGTEAWRVAEALAKAKVPVILDPTRNLPSSFDRVHVRDDAPKLLRDAGVQVAISTLGDAANARTLRQLCGVAVAFGMPWDDALAAVTTVPAAMFGTTDRGELKKGAAADVVVWSGDPFELSSRAEHVFIGGVEQSLETRQTRLLERYRRM
jgi:imidazolonepropionase-like amidohydrolase